MTAAHWGKGVCGRGVERNQLPPNPETLHNCLLADSRASPSAFRLSSSLLLPVARCLPEMIIVPASSAQQGDTRPPGRALLAGTCSADNPYIRPHVALVLSGRLPSWGRQLWRRQLWGRRCGPSLRLSREQRGRRVSRGRGRGAGRPAEPAAMSPSASPGDGAGEQPRLRAGGRDPGRGRGGDGTGGSCPCRAGRDRAGLRQPCGHRGLPRRHPPAPLGPCLNGRARPTGIPPFLARRPPLLSPAPPLAQRFGSPDALRSQFSSPALLLQ